MAGLSTRIVPIQRDPAAAYIAPFFVYAAGMVAARALDVPLQVAYPIQLALTLVPLLAVSRRDIKLRPEFPLSSIAIGLAVFVLWVAPDLLFGYRHHWLFESFLTGKASTSISPALQRNAAFLLIRTAGSVLLVPLVEELFWRAWFMRWYINSRFQDVPLGTYSAAAFWVTAALFAAEHGPYWEVGLGAGIAYNWWMIRTRSLADCVLAHAVTNGALAAYVMIAGAWQYWL